MVAADFMAVFPAVPRRRRDAHGSRPPSAGDGLGIGMAAPTDEGWALLCHKLCCGTDSVNGVCRQAVLQAAMRHAVKA